MRHLIDQVDEVQALGAVEVALMHGVHPHESRTALEMRPAPFADANLDCLGLVDVATAVLVRGAAMVPCSRPAPRSPHVVITRPLQAHVSLDKSAH